MQNATFRSDCKFEPLIQTPLEQLLMACNVSFGFKQMHLYINEGGTPTEKAIQLIKGGFKNKHKSPFFTQHLDTFVSVENIYSRLPSSYEFAGIDSALIDGKYHYTFSLYAALMFYKVEGIKFQIYGKLKGKTRASKKSIRIGKISLQTSFQRQPRTCHRTVTHD